MFERFVNRYTIRLGHCGLGGTDYQIHARPEDLAALASKLLARLDDFREGKAPMQELMKRHDLEFRAGDSVPLLSEYVTLSKQRTDRMCISFHATDSLDEDHIIESTNPSISSTWRFLGKALWVLVLPVVGAVYCVYGAFVLLPKLIVNGVLW